MKLSVRGCWGVWALAYAVSDTQFTANKIFECSFIWRMLCCEGWLSDIKAPQIIDLGSLYRKKNRVTGGYITSKICFSTQYDRESVSTVLNHMTCFAVSCSIWIFNILDLYWRRLSYLDVLPGEFLVSRLYRTIECWARLLDCVLVGWAFRAEYCLDDSSRDLTFKTMLWSL